MATLTTTIEVVGAKDGANQIKDFSDSLNDAGDNAKTAGSNFQNVGSKLSDFKSNLAGVVGSFTALSTSILEIVRSFTQYEQSQVRLEQANKRVSDATNKLEASQRKYNEAVSKYGESSKQAQDALKNVETNTKGLEIAQQRQVLQQQKTNEQLAELASTIVPGVIGVFGSLVGIIGNFTQKNSEGVNMLGKLKQSFLDLVSGGGNVKSTLDSAGTSMGGLGTKAGTAGTAASGLKNEVVQLGTGITQAVPGMTNLSGGMTNTAVAAERSAGPLGNIERAVSAVAPAAAGATAPLSSLGGAMGEAGAVSAEAAGSLEAAAVSSGALETGAAAATTETVAMAGAVGGVTIATAAMTAGLALAVAAIVAYVFNIGGFRDKTNAAIDAAEKFLAIGWSSFTQKFKPVTDAIGGAIKGFEDLIGKAGDFAKLDVSGQFKKQPAPGQAPGPSGRPLDETIAAENPAIEKGTAGILNMVNAMKQLAEQRVQMEGLSKTGVANSNANAEAFKKEQQAVQSLATTEAQRAAAVKAAAAAEKERQSSITAASTAMQQTVQITQQAAEVARNYTDALEQSNAASKGFGDAMKALDTAIGTNTGTIRANNEILNSSVSVQKLYTQGQQEMIIQLQNAQKSLIQSQGALAALNANLDAAKLTAYNQGWIDYNRTIADTAVKTANAQGQFDAFISSLSNSNSQIVQFNAGFVKGEEGIQKWVEGLAQAEGEMGGTRSALEQLGQVWGIQLPAAINASNDTLKAFESAMHGTTDSIQKGFAESDKILQNAVKSWQKFQEELNKPAKSFQDSMQNRAKAWQDELNNEVQTYGGYLTNLQRATIDGFAKISTTMSQMQNRLGLDLAGQDIKGFQQDWTNAINAMKTAAQSLPPTARPAFETIISLMEKLPVKTPQEAASAMTFFGQAISATQNPGTQLNPVINSLQGYLGQIGRSNAGGTVDQFGRSTQSAQDPVQKLQTASDSLKKVLIALTEKTFPMKIDTSNAVQAIDYLKFLMQKLVNPDEGPWKISPTVDTSAFLQSIGTMTAAVAGLMENITVQFNQGFAKAAQDAAGSMNNLAQTSQQDIQNIIAAVNAVAIAFNTQFAKAAQDAAGSMNNLAQTSQQDIQNIISAVNAVAIAFNTQFAKAAQDAAGSMNSLAQQSQTDIQNIISAVNAVAIAFNTQFAKAAQDAAGSMNNLAQTSQQDIQNIIAAVNAVAIAFNSGFSKAAQDAAGSMNNLAQTSQQDIQNIISAVNAVAIAFNSGFSKAAQDAAGSMNNLAQTSQQDIQNIIAAVNGVAIAFNTGFSRAAQDAAGNMNNLARNSQQDIQNIIAAVNAVPTAFNTAFSRAAQDAVGQINNIITALNKIPRTITVTVNVQQAGGATGYPASPYGYPVAARGGTFEMTPFGVKKLHAERGGSFIVSKPTRIGNLEVGEGHKPELITSYRGRGNHSGAMLLNVVPLPKLHAQSGGTFPVFGSTPGPGFFPGAGFTADPNYNPNPTIIDYGAGIPAVGASTVGAGQVGPGYLEAGPGVTQVAPPSEVGAGTIIVAKAGGGQSGPAGSPDLSNPAGFFSSITSSMSGQGGATPQTALPQEINQAVQEIASNTSSLAETSPYQMAQMAAQSIGNEIDPALKNTQMEIANLVSLIKKMFAKMSSGDTNTNLLVDGQKIASSVQKYIGSNAYGGM